MRIHWQLQKRQKWQNWFPNTRRYRFRQDWIRSSRV